MGCADTGDAVQAASVAIAAPIASVMRALPLASMWTYWPRVGESDDFRARARPTSASDSPAGRVSDEMRRSELILVHVTSAWRACEVATRWAGVRRSLR